MWGWGLRTDKVYITLSLALLTIFDNNNNNNNNKMVVWLEWPWYKTMNDKLQVKHNDSPVTPIYFRRTVLNEYDNFDILE